MSIDRTKYLNQKEVQQLISVTKARNGKRGKLAWMVVDFALNTGLRVSEIAKIKIEDIDFDRGLIHVIRSKRRKTKKEETIPSDTLICLVQRYMPMYLSMYLKIE